MSKSSKPDKPPSFEQAVAQLEQIIDRIESGEVALEQCLGEYEQGMKLIAHCRKVLDTAEQRIAELTADADGRLHVAGEADDEVEAEVEDEG
jgi:exodeoxyribonuclease VII small subunit